MFRWSRCCRVSVPFKKMNPSGYGAGHLTWPTGTYHFRRGRYLGSHGRSGPKVGAIDASTKSAKVPIAPGPTTRSLDLGEVPEGTGSPPAAAFLDRQPGISGRIGEADSAQPTRDGPCHGRLGFWPGLRPYFAAVVRMRGAVRTFGLGCTLPRGAAHTFQACNLTRTARVQ